MKVAIVSPYSLDVVGGVQAHVLSLAQALRAAGDQVLVLGPAAARDASGDAGWRAVGRSVAVPANGSLAPIAPGPSSAFRLRMILRRARPDVIHVHEPLVPVLGPAAVLGAPAPRVLTFHATAEGGALPVLYRGVRAPARAVVDRGEVRTAVSEVAARFHGAMLGLDPSSFVIVPNGVDVARFRTAERRTGGSRLVFLGRLEHRKGADVAVRAFLELAPQRPRLQLRVLGDGPLAAELAALVAAAPLEVRSRVELLGRVEPDALPRLLSESDVAVLPARGGESFGIVLLEVMAAGLPIVATDIPGYRAVARPGREALLVRPGDHEDLAGAIARVLDDDARADALRSAGLARAAAYDWAHLALRMRGVYARAIEMRATRAPRSMRKATRGG